MRTATLHHLSENRKNKDQYPLPWHGDNMAEVGTTGLQRSGARRKSAMASSRRPRAAPPALHFPRSRALARFRTPPMARRVGYRRAFRAWSCVARGAARLIDFIGGRKRPERSA